ncbi:regulatory protein, luxR family [Pedobacter nyackensis]|uniref:Regulatory protein, luxR family n=2 Tax=Pedobacter nyackensis TaxID=475255 RepID=A0A1W2DWI9_9SPHI|nr:regulatory protein, luxR family [Pedobacter nyackensis]
MHILTYVIVLLQSGMLLFYQLPYYLTRPQDKSRLWHLILLILLILYNVTRGLFPDPTYNLLLIAQNVIAYGSLFLMASYFPFFLYKVLELENLRFHALHIRQKSSMQPTNSYLTKLEVHVLYGTLVSWISMTIFPFFQVSQWIEVLVTNIGFMILNIMLISKTITNVRMLEQSLTKFKAEQLNRFRSNCWNCGLSERETQVAVLLCKGLRYQEISKTLFIAKKTIEGHTHNIFLKTGAKNRIELIQKLGLG